MESKLLKDAIASAPDRRRFLKKIALGAAATGAASMLNAQSAGPSDADILNFALNLEYLEAEFYTFATTGKSIDQMGVAVDGSGTAGTTTGGKQVNFTNPTFALSDIANEIAFDERAHVTFIRAALKGAGATPIARPAINLNALGIGFGNSTEFLTLARAFEDVGVTAYAGAAPLISDKTILGAAARIAETESLHSGNIRLMVAKLGIPTMPLDGVDVIPPPSGSSYFPVDGNALTQIRTPGQVLYLVYGNKANGTSGGFFPNGVNGTINMSSTAATPPAPAPGTTTAVVTPTTLTTGQASITLDASASASGNGPLTYFYMVLPGLVPAVLQTPNSPQAIVEFVNGPGVYNLQLVVTDASGKQSAPQKITLTYQP